MRRRSLSACAGLTLIELLVALAVFSVLGVLAWRGTERLVLARDRVDDELARWRDLGRAFRLVEQDLLQVAALGRTEQAGMELCPVLAAGGGDPRPPLPPPAAPDAVAERSELRLVLLASGPGVAQSAWRLSGRRLEWLHWDAAQSPREARVDTVLAGVRGLRWRFYADGAYRDCWPPDAGARNGLPAGVAVRLDVDGIGAVERFYALR